MSKIFGVVAKKAYCVEQVFDQDSFKHRGCFRYAWKDGYCKQHHPNTVCARREEADRRYKESIKKRPTYKLSKIRDYCDSILEKNQVSLDDIHKILELIK